MIKKDIINTEDINLMVQEFYTRVKKDDLIGFIFTEIIDFSWDIHIPIMVQFWESILLGKLNYKGNPIAKHIEISKKIKLTLEHFERWTSLFNQTVDHLFEGEKATEAKYRANLMGKLMLFKIDESQKKGFIQ